MKKPDFISSRDYSLLTEKFVGEELENAIKRLENHEPLAYVIGEWYFRNETYIVNPNVLIPRPETEHIVESIVKLCKKGGKIADFCTGSGCIAISSLVERKDITADAYDISDKALETAQKNATLNNVNDRIRFFQKDILTDSINEKYDIIASNPPYIATEVIKTLEPELFYEPQIALDGGDDGLKFYRSIIKNYEKNLRDNGYFIFEIGYDQGNALKEMGFDIIKDYSGNDRVAIKQVKR